MWVLQGLAALYVVYGGTELPLADVELGLSERTWWLGVHLEVSVDMVDTVVLWMIYYSCFDRMGARLA